MKLLSALSLSLITLAGVVCGSHAAPPRPTAKPAVSATGRAVYGSWHSSIIGGGGYVQNVVFCPSDPKRLYAYVDVGGIYRSDDDGSRWRMIFAGLKNPNVRGVSVDPRNSDILTAITGTQWDDGLAGIERSTDGGETWKVVQPAPFYGNEDFRWAGTLLARDPKNPDILLAASGKSGVFRSIDGGVTWSKTTGAEGIYPTDLQFDTRGSRVLLCATGRKMWRDGEIAGGYFVSNDSGKTWAKQGDTAPLEVHQDKTAPDTWYALFEADPQTQISRDNGKTWSPFIEGLPVVTEVEKSNFTSDIRYSAMQVGPNFVVIGGGKGSVYRRDSGDNAWRKVERQSLTEIYEGQPWYGRIMPHVWQHFGSAMGSLIVDPRDAKHWFFTDWFAIYQTHDAGATWNLSMNGVEVTVLHTLVQDSGDPTLVHLGMADNGYLRSNDAATRFYTNHTTSSTKCIVVSPVLPSRVYMTGNNQGQWKANQFFRSDDRGQTWTLADMTGLPDRESHNINSIAGDRKEIDTVYAAVTGDVTAGGGGGGIYKSTDGGKTWAFSGDGLPTGANVFHSEIWGIGHEIACDSVGNQVALDIDHKKIYRRGMGESVWQIVSGIEAEPRDVIIDPKTPGRFLLAGGWAGAFESRDGGKTWQKISDRNTQHIALDEANPDRIALGAKDGVYLSRDGGKTFVMTDARLPLRDSCIVAFAGNRLIVGTGGAGPFTCRCKHLGWPYDAVRQPCGKLVIVFAPKGPNINVFPRV